jgi:hypothetical protein
MNSSQVSMLLKDFERSPGIVKTVAEKPGDFL